MSQAYLGEIRMFGGSYAPESWSFCAGQTIYIAQNQALFAIIGNYYGGDGRQTMGLPNLIGRVPLHVGGPSGTGPGLTTHSLGERGGRSLATLNQSQLPPHRHSMAPAIKTAPEDESPLSNYKSSVPQIFSEETADMEPMNPAMLSNTGASQPHENRQPVLVINFIICESGIFPPRS